MITLVPGSRPVMWADTARRELFPWAGRSCRQHAEDVSVEQGNLVVRDVVQHIYEERYYGSRSTLTAALRRMFRNIRLYLAIVLVSCGVGFLVVSLPGLMSSRSSGSSGMAVPGDMESLKSKFDGLSDEQKQQVLEKFGKGQF